MEKLRPLLLPKFFDGKDEEFDIDDFFNYFEKVALANGWDEKDNLLYLRFCLKGSAEKYFDVIENDLTRQDKFEYMPVKEKLVNFYRSPLKLWKLEKELDTCSMEFEEDGRDFVARVLSLCRKVDSNMHESRIIRIILRGLSSNIFERIIMLSNSTIVELYKNIEKYELSCQYLNEWKFGQVQVINDIMEPEFEELLEIGNEFENENCLENAIICDDFDSCNYYVSNEVDVYCHVSNFEIENGLDEVLICNDCDLNEEDIIYKEDKDREMIKEELSDLSESDLDFSFTIDNRPFEHFVNSGMRNDCESRGVKMHQNVSLVNNRTNRKRRRKKCKVCGKHNHFTRNCFYNVNYAYRVYKRMHRICEKEGYDIRVCSFDGRKFSENARRKKAYFTDRTQEFSTRHIDENVLDGGPSNIDNSRNELGGCIVTESGSTLEGVRHNGIYVRRNYSNTDDKKYSISHKHEIDLVDIKINYSQKCGSANNGVERNITDSCYLELKSITDDNKHFVNKMNESIIIDKQEPGHGNSILNRLQKKCESAICVNSEGENTESDLNYCNYPKDMKNNKIETDGIVINESSVEKYDDIILNSLESVSQLSVNSDEIFIETIILERFEKRTQTQQTQRKYYMRQYC
ncbi:uncharacterized protein LOC120351351 isoform X2 [Nilaparvata lugens]|uniref:uncharacterized protein LOC120351351 isoform X1 n=1 Tax=Nilaparvata lugens TaxID=108931 RepID=UPI00193EB90A|nr:uncharacterized protein LOC120351351 isoform X1 [Nilaparvata lugens]XP_039284227.1 uncharacterized protein LOC120351351 isoform X2 [Nilaparvata lugens]